MDHLLRCHLKQELISSRQVEESLSPSTDEFFSGFKALKLCPWLAEEFTKKHNFAATMMFQENCLAATYKCMEKNCIFFSSLDTVFTQNIKLHSMKVNDSHDGQNDCAYCEFKAIECNELIHHIESDHKQDIYQCTGCSPSTYRKSIEQLRFV